MAINDGGYWYPRGLGDGHHADRGATVRDVFAAHVVAGLMSRKIVQDGQLAAPDLAAWAYHIADALIAARARDYHAAGQDDPSPRPGPTDRELPWRLELDPDPAA